jgi:tousled-like kinase
MTLFFLIQMQKDNNSIPVCILLESIMMKRSVPLDSKISNYNTHISLLQSSPGNSRDELSKDVSNHSFSNDQTRSRRRKPQHPTKYEVPSNKRPREVRDVNDDQSSKSPSNNRKSGPGTFSAASNFPEQGTHNEPSSSITALVPDVKRSPSPAISTQQPSAPLQSASPPPSSAADAKKQPGSMMTYLTKPQQPAPASTSKKRPFTQPTDANSVPASQHVPPASFQTPAPSQKPAVNAPSGKMDEKDKLISQLKAEHSLSLQTLRSELASLREEISSERTQFAGYKQSRLVSMASLAKILRDSFLRDASHNRQRLAMQQGRLGKHSAQRQPGITAQLVEVWEDGDEFLQIAQEEAFIRCKREELEQKKKDLSKKHKRIRGVASAGSARKGAKRSAASDASDTNGDDQDTDLGDSDLVSGLSPADVVCLLTEELSIKSALSALSAQEKALEARKRDLIVERTTLRHELQLLKHEASSRWRGYPTLSDRFLLQKMLGKGGFSEVWKAVDLEEGAEVAIKIHQLNPHWDDAKKSNYVRHALRESKMLEESCHINIVRLVKTIIVDNDALATVMEYASGGDLDKLIKAQETLPEAEAKAIMMQILSALAYMNGYETPWSTLSSPTPSGKGSRSSAAAEGDESPAAGAPIPATSMPPPSSRRRRIIHYDLKPANILFDEFHRVKVSDFGLSKYMPLGDSNDDSADGGGNGSEVTSIELTSQGAGTYWYLPPECFGANPQISSRVDVFSLGVIFYQMMFGHRPFGHGMTQDQVVSNRVMLEQPFRPVEFPAAPRISNEAKRFVQRCLIGDRHSRPDVLELMDDAYLHMRPR